MKGVVWVGGVGTLKLKIPLFFKGNMHQKYDISLKDAFYIIDLLAEFFLLKILNHTQRGTFCPLPFPSHPPHF